MSPPSPLLPDPWMQAMLAGDFAAAWRISDVVLRRRAGESCARLPHHLRWVWRGEPLAGKRVLVRCYHGLGDTLQFIRLVPLVARRAKSVAVEAQPELLPLLESVEGVSALAPLDGATPAHDVDIESMELPHALRLTLRTIPTVPYLAPPRPAAKTAWPAGEGGRLRVGLVWQAGGWRPERSVPIDLFGWLHNMPVDLFSLQQGAALAELDQSALASRRPVSRLPPACSVAETAAVIAALDLIITVDTMVAHLAGALARPVFMLLDSAADWRWMRDRRDSPWYPTMCLFRQSRPGAWNEPMTELREALVALVARRREERGEPRLRCEESGNESEAAHDRARDGASA